mgnify:CR=1 FL=1
MMSSAMHPTAFQSWLQRRSRLLSGLQQQRANMDGCARLPQASRTCLQSIVAAKQEDLLYRTSEIGENMSAMDQEWIPRAQLPIKLDVARPEPHGRR